MSYQTALTNLTPFAVENYVLVTPDGQEAVSVPALVAVPIGGR